MFLGGFAYIPENCQTRVSLAPVTQNPEMTSRNGKGLRSRKLHAKDSKATLWGPSGECVAIAAPSSCASTVCRQAREARCMWSAGGRSQGSCSRGMEGTRGLRDQGNLALILQYLAWRWTLQTIGAIWDECPMRCNTRAQPTVTRRAAGA